MRVLGYVVAEGVSQKGGGSPFSIPKVFLSVGVESMKTKHMTVAGKGYQGVEMPLDLGAVPQFEKIVFPREGLELDLLIDQRAVFGELKPVCVGIRQPAAKAA